MKRFLITFSLFLLPLAIFFAVPAVVLYRAHEFMTPQEIGELVRNGKHILVGQAYYDSRAQYQLQETLARTPEVLTLGTSRVGTFRAEFLKDPAKFYNATGVSSVFQRNRDFLQAIAAHPPAIVIADMSQFFYAPDSEKKGIITGPNTLIQPHPWYEPFTHGYFLSQGWWKVYVDIAHGKIPLRELFTSNDTDVVRIGLRAILLTSGYLNDGSNYYGEVIGVPETQEDVLKSIELFSQTIDETHGDEYGTSISEAALAETRRFLETAKREHVTVIGFLPPISVSEYNALVSHPDAPYATTFRTLAPTLASLYKEYGYDFYDFSNIAALGSGNEEMVEAKHGGEKLYLRMFIKMAEGTPTLREYVDLPELRSKLRSAASSYSVFPMYRR